METLAVNKIPKTGKTEFDYCLLHFTLQRKLGRSLSMNQKQPQKRNNKRPPVTATHASQSWKKGAYVLKECVPSKKGKKRTGPKTNGGRNAKVPKNTPKKSNGKGARGNVTPGVGQRKQESYRRRQDSVQTRQNAWRAFSGIGTA